MLMKKILLLALAFCFTLAFSGPAMAITWTESGDAGQLAGTAQVISVADPLTQIFGNLGLSNIDSNSLLDVDMFLIYIFDPLNFSATTLDGANLVSDPQLFLFGLDGRGIYMNDDADSGLLGSQSQLPAGNLLSPVSPGLYYLAIGWFDNEPFSEINGRIFEDLFGTAGPDLFAGGLNPVYSWYNDVNGRIDLPILYQIDLTGAGFAPIPEPGTLLLVGGGLFGMLGYKLQRRRSGGPERS